MEKTKQNKKSKGKIFLKVIIIIIAVIAVFAVAVAVINTIGVKSNKNLIKSIDAVTYENQLVPAAADNGFYTFVTDNDLKVMQLTDVHIGGGFMSIRKDSMAINAVAAMITAEKPDFVIITGDIAYPVPFQAGTFNNKTSAVMFAELMEQLGVYWAPVFGNHDTEAYSFYSREDIAKDVYGSGKYEHCLFQTGPDDVDGFSNYVVNVKNSAGLITQSFFMFDSHSYLGNDPIGVLWNYDCIHENQVEWYENTVKALTAENNGVTPKSLAFFHIPLIEYKDAWNEYKNNNYQDTENVKYVYGKLGEKDEGIYSSELNNGLFDKMLELGSTKGLFCGHDHLNNFALDYKGIKLCYGYSIDYLAYSGIMKYGLQRGCTIIDVSPDGSFTSRLENYYQDKYQPVSEKEAVLMEDYYSEQ